MRSRAGSSPAAPPLPDSVSEAELIDLVADELGSYKKPVGVTITTDPLPKSPVGKIKRKDLREPFWEGHERRVSGS